jgi:hypothetical protein
MVALSSIEAKYQALTKGAKNQCGCSTLFKCLGCYKIKPLMFMSIIIVALKLQRTMFSMFMRST